MVKIRVLFGYVLFVNFNYLQLVPTLIFFNNLRVYNTENGTEWNGIKLKFLFEHDIDLEICWKLHSFDKNSSIIANECK